MGVGQQVGKRGWRRQIGEDHINVVEPRELDLLVWELEEIERAGLDANVSIKPTGLGLKLDLGLCRANLESVVRAAAEITKLELPADALELLTDQQLAERTFVMWDMIHDRAHMRGDLPFDPFMIKHRMPFF